jgi:multiple sugar transport system substrate-binding protein
MSDDLITGDPARQGPLGEYDDDELVFHPGGVITRKRFLLAAAGSAFGAAAGPLIFSGIAEAKIDGAALAAKLPYKANLGVKGNLEFWHFWSSPLRRGAIHRAIQQFHSVYRHVTISDLPVPASDIYNKLDAAVAAQSGVPDVVVSNRLTLWSDVPQHHLYTDFTPYYAKTPISGKIFWPVNWQQVLVKQKGKNHIYGLPFETDIRVMFINRGAIAQAGYSPSAAPKTWAQLKSWADKLDQKGSRITVWPLDLGLDELVWLSNGDWQNKQEYPTANSAANIAAADWAKSYVDRYGGMTGYNELKTKITNQALDYFASGLQVIHFDQPTYQTFTLVNNGVNFGIPSNSNPKISKIFPYWGVAFLPVEKSSIKPWSFSGGFSISAPRNKHRSSAKTAAAWEFTKFMSLVGQLTFEQFAGNIPCVIKQAHNPAVANKNHWGTFLAALKYQHKLTENKWDTAYPGDVVPTATNDIEGGASGKTALDKAQTQALANMKRNGGP